MINNTARTPIEKLLQFLERDPCRLEDYSSAEIEGLPISMVRERLAELKVEAATQAPLLEELLGSAHADSESLDKIDFDEGRTDEQHIGALSLADVRQQLNCEGMSSVRGVQHVKALTGSSEESLSAGVVLWRRGWARFDKMRRIENIISKGAVAAGILLMASVLGDLALYNKVTKLEREQRAAERRTTSLILKKIERLEEKLPPDGGTTAVQLPPPHIDKAVVGAKDHHVQNGMGNSEPNNSPEPEAPLIKANKAVGPARNQGEADLSLRNRNSASVARVAKSAVRGEKDLALRRRASEVRNLHHSAAGYSGSGPTRMSVNYTRDVSSPAGLISVNMSGPP
jgi:hypothetical protein